MYRPSINLSSFWVPSWILKAEVPVLVINIIRERKKETSSVVAHNYCQAMAATASLLISKRDVYQSRISVI
jgi:hypothetical protein